MRNLVGPLQLSETILCPSMFRKSSILLSSKLSYFYRIENDDSFGTSNCSLGDQYIHQTYSEILPRFHSVAIRLLLGRITPCVLQRVTLATLKEEGTPSRVEAPDSSVA